MIDPTTGVLLFEEPPVQFGPALTRTQFFSSTESNGAVDFVKNEPWHSWKLKGQHTSASLPFIVVLYFHGESLTMVNLCHDDPKYGTSWEDWTLEKEMSRKGTHDQWLSAILGDRRSFPWGRVGSEYDQRSGGSSIVISYELR